MGDGIKLLKDKRHRSSSSIAAVPIEGVRSERKLDIRASIPEVDDQFAVAESRCTNLQQKIDLIKNIKKKKKTKRRSIRVSEPEVTDNIPVISVHTKPKQKISQQAGLGAGQQHEGSRAGSRPQVYPRRSDHAKGRKGKTDLLPNVRWSEYRRGRADGDASERSASQEAAYGDDELLPPDPRARHVSREVYTGARRLVEKPTKTHRPSDWKSSNTKREGVDKEKAEIWPEVSKIKSQPPKICTVTGVKTDERPIVELFNKRATSPDKGRSSPIYPEEISSGPFEEEPSTSPVLKKKDARHRLRSRHYETPTISSRMKRSCGRLGALRTDIPFVVSSSTAPSHNLGVNLQQILNSLKTQLPPKGIPLTIAYYLGMGHVPSNNNSKSAIAPGNLDVGELNAIRAGGRFLRVPQRRQLSYRRALTMLRVGEGALPRYLRTVVRPRSMCELSTRTDEFVEVSEDHDGGEEVKKSLAEYAGLYRELERMTEQLAEHPNNELEHQRRQLAKELNARENLIRKIVEDYSNTEDGISKTLRASASNAEDTYRHSVLNLNGN